MYRTILVLGIFQLAVVLATGPALADCGSAEGQWHNGMHNGRSSTWTLTPRSDGRYDARESGLGNATGTATLRGRILRIEWQTGGHRGYYVWRLEPGCETGTGSVVHTDGDNVNVASTVTRQSSPGSHQAACGNDGRFANIQWQFDRLEAIKANPDTFRVDVDFQQEPFEICIKNGVATLKGNPAAWQKVAGFTSRALEGFVARAGPGPAASAAAQESARKAFLDTATRRARDSAAAAGKYMSLREVKRLAGHADVAGKVVKTAVSSALKPLEPTAFARQKTSSYFSDRFFGGHLTVPAAEGIKIYTELQTAADVVRANNRRLYCSILASQARLARDIKAAYDATFAGASRACKARNQEQRRKLRHMSDKLRHDLDSAGGRTGYLREYGTNWTLDARYRGLDCVERYARAAPRLPRR